MKKDKFSKVTQVKKESRASVGPVPPTKAVPQKYKTMKHNDTTNYHEWTSCEVHGHLFEDGICVDCGEECVGGDED